MNSRADVTLAMFLGTAVSRHRPALGLAVLVVLLYVVVLALLGPGGVRVPSRQLRPRRQARST